MIVEYLTENGQWTDACRHEADEETTTPIEQPSMFAAGPVYYTTARCAKCGEWFTTNNTQETLI